MNSGLAYAETLCVPLSPPTRLRNLPRMEFELIGEPADVQRIATNLSIRESADLKARYGGRRWRKLKGIGLVRLANGNVRRAEVHWYEAHGVGRRKLKIKRLLD